jgi:hypothetical protein
MLIDRLDWRCQSLDLDDSLTYDLALAYDLHGPITKGDKSYVAKSYAGTKSYLPDTYLAS